MPDNNFTRDTLSGRSERLQLIKLNFDDVIDDLEGIPSSVSTWAATCNEAYIALRVAAESADGQVKGTTTASKEAFKFLKSEYLIVKAIASDIFDDDKERFEYYNFYLPYPPTQDEQLFRIRDVLNENARAVTASLTPVLPTNLVTRLTTALAAATAAGEAKFKAKEAAINAYRFLKTRWNADSKLLKKLYNLCVANWGDDDPRLNLLGYACASQLNTGGGGHVPDAPSGLHLIDSTLAWTSVQGATSYGVSLSSDGGSNWESDIPASSNSQTVPVLEIGKLYYRVRARNAHGFGEYSGTFEYLFGLGNVENFVVESNELTWSPVEFANGYDIQRTTTGEDSWVLIYNSGGLTYHDAPGTGNWSYRIRASYGTVKGEWTEAAVEYS
jgi:hypothetical protein